MLPPGHWLRITVTERKLHLRPESVPAKCTNGQAIEAAECTLHAALAEEGPGAGEVRDQIQLEDRGNRGRSCNLCVHSSLSGGHPRHFKAWHLSRLLGPMRIQDATAREVPS